MSERLANSPSDDQKLNSRNLMPAGRRNISAPPKQGLYDPQFEHDACGVGFVVNMKGKKSHTIVEQALQVLAQSRSPRRVRLRGEHRRRRGHPDADAARLSAGSAAKAAKISLPAPANTAWAWCSCRTTPRSAPSANGFLATSWPRKASACSAGATIPTNNASLGATAEGVRAVHAAGVHRAQREADR